MIAIDPQFADGWYSLGLLVGENPQRLEEAASACLRAAELSPGSASACGTTHGVALLHLQRLEESAAALRRALTLAPNDPDIRAAWAALRGTPAIGRRRHPGGKA